MRIGIGLPNQVPNVRAELIPRWASLAEEAGFNSLGTVGRLAYPGVADTVALAAAAGASRTIGLISTVLVAPSWPAVLLAKELAGIDAVSGGRLTVGVGVGPRADDFPTGESFASRGRRLDDDLQIYRDVWAGKPVGDGGSPAVADGTRSLPLLFGGFAPAALRRMATWGDGYIGASFPPELIAPSYEAARAAWKQAGRAGSPRLVAMSYFNLSDEERGRDNVFDYYRFAPEFAELASRTLPAGVRAVKERIAAFADLGAEEIILTPTLGTIDELCRLADAVL
ncbi:LLM class flavin-dependent oxidoreductase [Kribbella sp. CA-253562]|uniref:LLM class flavin-dependent oxidoreductase n=1 Tax=Kribbella sp. CA-253562 TaxID=3239942 RepID=UPI003D930759